MDSVTCVDDFELILRLYRVKTSINVFTEPDLDDAVASLFPDGRPSETKLEELRGVRLMSQFFSTEDELHFVVCVPEAEFTWVYQFQVKVLIQWHSDEVFERGVKRKRARMDDTWSGTHSSTHLPNVVRGEARGKYLTLQLVSIF